MRANAFQALKSPNFALYLATLFLATTAQQIQAVALGWQIYALTHNPFHLGLVGLCEFLPAASLALITGPLADRFERRRLVLIGLAGEVVAAVVLTTLTLAGGISVGAILTMAAIFGAGRALVAPAVRALMADILPAKHYANGVAWNSTAWQIATIGGPALGGLLYALAPAVPFAATGLGLAGAFTAAAWLTVAARADPPEHIDLMNAVAGLVLILRHRLLLGLISLDLFAVLFSGAVALLPVFARDVLEVGPAGLGFLRSAPGIGAVVTALALTRWPLARHAGQRLLTAVGIFGIAAITFGLSRDARLSFAALMVLGAADMVSVYVRGTLVPLATPNSLRGRVLAVEAVFIGGSNELGAFVAGSAAALLGPVVAVLAGGSLTLCVTFVWRRLFPGLAAVDRMEDVAHFRPEAARDRITAATGE